MSTANFLINHEAFKNICYISEESDEDLIYWDYEDFIDNFKFELKQQNFDFFKVELKSGYYDGIQVVIDSNNDYLTESDMINGTFNNADSQYIFNMCKSAAVRKIKTEVNKINKFLTGLKGYGFREFAQVAQFSNGETIYKYI